MCEDTCQESIVSHTETYVLIKQAVAFQLYLKNCKIIKCRNAIYRGLPVAKKMSDACAAQLVRAVDWQLIDLVRIPAQSEAFLFPQKYFGFLESDCTQY